jgi:hypothetical protein
MAKAPARMAPDEVAAKMEALPSRLARHNVHRGGEIDDAAGDVGVVAGAAGAAVAVMIHGPHVETMPREHVHGGVFAAARNGEIEAGAGRVRRAVHEEKNRQRRLARLRCLQTLAIEVEREVPLLGPVFAAPYLAGRAGLTDRCPAGSAAVSAAWARLDSIAVPIPRPLPAMKVRRGSCVSGI